jgi:two-component system response regulator DevR
MNVPPEKLDILLVDDHAVVRVGLRNLINDSLDMRVVGEAPDGASALRMAAKSNPDVILLDLRLPDRPGIEIIEPLKTITPDARVLVLTSFADDGLLLAALKAGADGYLLKDVAEADLLEAIRQVSRASMVAPMPGAENPAAGRPSPSNLETLTGQECRVFELVGRGLSNREAAEAAGLTEKTVRNYLSRIFEKLQLQRRSQLVALFVGSRPWRK